MHIKDIPSLLSSCLYTINWGPEKMCYNSKSTHKVQYPTNEFLLKCVDAAKNII